MTGEGIGDAVKLVGVGPPDEPNRYMYSKLMRERLRKEGIEEAGRRLEQAYTGQTPAPQNPIYSAPEQVGNIFERLAALALDHPKLVEAIQRGDERAERIQKSLEELGRYVQGLAADFREKQTRDSELVAQYKQANERLVGQYGELEQSNLQGSIADLRSTIIQNRSDIVGAVADLVTRTEGWIGTLSEGYRGLGEKVVENLKVIRQENAQSIGNLKHEISGSVDALLAPSQLRRYLTDAIVQGFLEASDRGLSLVKLDANTLANFSGLGEIAVAAQSCQQASVKIEKGLRNAEQLVADLEAVKTATQAFVEETRANYGEIKTRQEYGIKKVESLDEKNRQRTRVVYDGLRDIRNVLGEVSTKVEEVLAREYNLSKKDVVKLGRIFLEVVKRMPGFDYTQIDTRLRTVLGIEKGSFVDLLKQGFSLSEEERAGLIQAMENAVERKTVGETRMREIFAEAAQGVSVGLKDKDLTATVELSVRAAEKRFGDQLQGAEERIGTRVETAISGVEDRLKKYIDNTLGKTAKAVEGIAQTTQEAGRKIEELTRKKERPPPKPREERPKSPPKKPLDPKKFWGGIFGQGK